MPAQQTGAITLNFYSGRREPLTGKSVLLTVRDGNQRQVHRRHHKSSTVTLKGLTYFNNFGDNYTVIASAKGHRQAGFTPVVLHPQVTAVAHLMLLSTDAAYDFHEARWDALSGDPVFGRLLRAGARSDSDARDRYTDLMEHRPDALACLLNLVTAVSQIHLSRGTPVDYVRQLIWDKTMEQDRLFCWAADDLVDQVVQAAAGGVFTPQPGSAFFHPGATRSFKEKRFGEANVQITFHENDKKTIDGVKCVKMELDIDYYRDLLAHALLEVVVNRLTGSATNPKQVYVLRWIAGCQAGLPEFEPPYRLA
jgi:hypothetical protein